MRLPWRRDRRDHGRDHGTDRPDRAGATPAGGRPAAEPSRNVLFGTTGTLVMDQLAVPVDLVFGYDADDPYAVDMLASYGEFQASWLLSRNLLLAGSTRPTGTRAVKVRPRIDAEGRRYVAITVLSRELGTIHVRHADIWKFLTETTRIVPLGEEDMALDVEASLLELLTGDG